MSLGWLVLFLAGLGVLGFAAGRARALRLAGGDRRRLHSLPAHYGAEVALFGLLPALILLLIWLPAQSLVVSRIVAGELPQGLEPGAFSLMMSDVRRVAQSLNEAGGEGAGVATSSGLTPDMLAAAGTMQRLTGLGQALRLWAMLALAVAGIALGLWRIRPDQRARNLVEAVMRAILVLAALIAILTTLGIIASMLFNTFAFFRLYPAADFFFGTTWSPSFGGGSALGILPLLWGTLYISLIALLVAVPIGLFSAIYLSEYAGPRVRGLLKPLLELLAGIPTIVYGLFALTIVGPALVAVFGPDGTGWMQGGSAVMTAGLVMGVMLIPFVSSLSDDILNAVPQALRDGSLGLGATRSETLRLVVLPAALPGVVGAVLLAASRAIGETMIVVMGAGAAARLSLNPFDAMTTVTAKIVSQLTGDADFASPEALVAFALGMTLFTLTLGLNVVALVIVRRYREQYE